MNRSLLTTALLVLVGVGGAAIAVEWGGTTESADERAIDVAPMAPEVLLLVDGNDVYSAGPFDQTRKALDRAGVPHVVHDLAASAALPELGGFGAVITVVEQMRQLDGASADRLEAFVEAGGGLVVAHRGWSRRLSSLLGFASPEGVAFDLDPATTLRFRQPLMPGGDAMTLGNLRLSSYDTDVGPGCDVIADRGPDAAPTVWTCARGAGRVVYWNAALIGTKPYRGMLLQSLAAVYPEHVRPLANWAVIYLDDFPSPASNGQVAPIWQESKQTPAQFYAETWYPDMQRLAERYGLAYTSALIFAYNGRTEPPFPMNEWLTGRIDVRGDLTPYSPWITVESAHRDEMGLHGYNHQSLLTRLWGSQEAMEEALVVARDRWAYENIAPFPKTYVPPQNWIDSTGVAALRAVFPEIETVAGLYVGEYAVGQDREFGPEPWNPDLYALPRNTSGFILTDNHRLLLLSVLHTVGAWSHFVHPDEVFMNPDREETYRLMGLPPPGEIGWYGKDGDGFYPQFEAWLQFMETHYPWLESVTAEEAARRMRRFDQLEVAWERGRDESGRQLAIDASFAGQIVTTWAAPGETLASATGAEVLHTWEGPLMTQIVLRVTDHHASLRFSPSPA